MKNYIPKSKYKLLQSSGNEYTFQGRPYVGPYILTPEGAFMGNTPTDIGPPLKKRRDYVKNRKNNILENAKTNEYYKVNDGVVKFIQKTSQIISTKTKPTKIDYEFGSYIRYFAKKVNTTTDYFEISKKTYKLIKVKSKRFDYNAYEVGNIRWALEGDTATVNTNTLKAKGMRYPNIASLFRNVNEFSRAKIINNQYANEGELFFKEDPQREYIGLYHIHPTKGPMVGAEHVSSPHSLLIFAKDKKDNNSIYKKSEKSPITSTYKPSPTISEKLKEKKLTQVNQDPNKVTLIQPEDFSDIHGSDYGTFPGKEGGF